MTNDEKKPVFPLVRHLSQRVTPLLAKTPLSANHVTTLSMACGLGAAWFLFRGDQISTLLGALLLIICYIFDNCDGEIARLKNQCSKFGQYYDSFVDWVVHAAFFPTLGYGFASHSGETLWITLGWVAAAGATINYGLGWYFEFRDRGGDGEPEDHEDVSGEGNEPQGLFGWFVFVFRELTRADFCFLVLILALFDVLWVLLPAGAIGAQVYWVTQCWRTARQHHV